MVYKNDLNVQLAVINRLLPNKHYELLHKDRYQLTQGKAPVSPWLTAPDMSQWLAAFILGVLARAK